jgi:hypothetical protein
MCRQESLHVSRDLILIVEALQSSRDRRSQLPHCDSLNKDRYLFSVERKDNLFHPIVAVDGLYEVQLGQAHDIKADDRFLIFKEAAFSSECIGVTTKIHVFELCSHLEPPSPSITLSKAFAVKAVPSSQSPIRIAMKDESINIQNLDREWLELLGVELVDNGKEESSMLMLSADGSWMKLTFTNSYPFANSVPFARTLFHQWQPANNDELYPIFAQIGHFYHQLEVPCTPRVPSIEVKMVPVNLVKQDDQEIYQEAPDRESISLSPWNPPLHVVADDTTEYGFKITNNFSLPIYFSFFYLSQTRFSIGA